MSGSIPPSHADIYSPIKCVLELIETDKPGKGYTELEEVLGEAGLVSSSHLAMLPKDVLCIISDMGRARARVLRNYARRCVLPVLGLKGNYDNPEIASLDKGNTHAMVEVEDSTREDDLWQLEDDDDESNEDNESNEDDESNEGGLTEEEG